MQHISYEYIKSLNVYEEIKDEYKKLEGDPIIKQRQREAQMQMSQGGKWELFLMQMLLLQTLFICYSNTVYT